MEGLLINSLPPSSKIFDFGGSTPTYWTAPGNFFRHAITNKVFKVVGQMNPLTYTNVIATDVPSDSAVVPVFLLSGRIVATKSGSTVTVGILSTEKLVLDAVTVSNPVVWISGVAYKVGDYVTHNSKIWRCALAHTAQIDWYPGAPALWLWGEVGTSGGTIIQIQYVDREVEKFVYVSTPGPVTTKTVNKTSGVSLAVAAIVGAMISGAIVATSDDDENKETVVSRVEIS